MPFGNVSLFFIATSTYERFTFKFRSENIMCMHSACRENSKDVPFFLSIKSRMDCLRTQISCEGLFCSELLYVF